MTYGAIALRQRPERDQSEHHDPNRQRGPDRLLCHIQRNMVFENVRIGHFKEPIGLEHLTSSNYFQPPARIAETGLSANAGLGLGCSLRTQAGRQLPCRINGRRRRRFGGWICTSAIRRVRFCEANLHVCSHRRRRLFTLEGPWLLVVRLGHCPDPGCPGHHGTVSPSEEMAIAPPRLTVAWDVFAWIGHRRFARHWSVPQICAELSDSHRIDLSEDAVEDYVRQYEVMVAARHTDLEQMRKAYAQTKSLVLAIDGLQPEKGHETLYVVRELTQKRVWFAEPLLSSTNDEVRRVLARAGRSPRRWAFP